MSGLHTGGRVLLIASDRGLDVESYKHELDCVLSVINNGRLGMGVDPKSIGWGSDAHAAAVKRVIEHAREVEKAIAKEQRREAASERRAAISGQKPAEGEKG